jgi:hypothetical protein
VEHVGLDINGLSLDLVGPAGIVSESANDGGNIATGVADGLSVVERLNSGEDLLVLVADFGELLEEDTTLVGGGELPLSVESLAGSGDGEIDVLLGTLADGGDDLLGGGVDDLELLLVDTLDPLAVNEAGDVLVRNIDWNPGIRGKQTYRPMG